MRKPLFHGSLGQPHHRSWNILPKGTLISNPGTSKCLPHRTMHHRQSSSLAFRCAIPGLRLPDGPFNEVPLAVTLPLARLNLYY